MKKQLYKVFLGCLAMIAISCSKSGNVVPDNKDADAAILTFPLNNTICVSGNSLSATQSSVLFKWNGAQNAVKYTVTVKDLLTGQTQIIDTDVSQATVTVAKNTPYLWFVTSHPASGNQVNKSEEWRFYNAGDGVISYAPFPADKLIPNGDTEVTLSSTGKVKLTWESADPDNDILFYDVYLGTSSSPNLLSSNLPSANLSDISLNKNTIYFWKVVTHDSKGNSSVSAVVGFKTK